MSQNNVTAMGGGQGQSAWNTRPVPFSWADFVLGLVVGALLF